MTERLLEARWPISLAFVAALVLAWQLAIAFLSPPDYLLAPTAIAGGLVDQLGEGDLVANTLASLRRALTGFALGATVGVIVGLLAGVARVAEDLIDPLVSVTYPLPKIALFPIVVLWLGFNDSARILVIALSCFYPAFVNALAGTRGIDVRFIWAARSFGASRLRRFFQVVLPAALPSIVVGLRISLALAFVLAFATEAIGASRDGLGFVIEEAYDNLLYEQMYAGIAMFALLGFVADQVLKQGAKRFLHGQQLEAVGRA